MAAVLRRSARHRLATKATKPGRCPNRSISNDAGMVLSMAATVITATGNGASEASNASLAPTSPENVKAIAALAR